MGPSFDLQVFSTLEENHEEHVAPRKRMKKVCFWGRKWPTRFFNAGCLVSSDAGCRLLVHDFVDLYGDRHSQKVANSKGP